MPDWLKLAKNPEPESSIPTVSELEEIIKF